MIKQVCATIVLVAVTASTLLGQTPHRGASRSGHRKQQSDPATAELTRIEREWHQALERNDLPALDRLLAPDWFITNGSGMIITKSELLAALRTGEVKFVSTVPSEIKVHAYHRAAVVTKRSTDQTMYGSSPGGGRYQMTDMFVRLGGRWQCIATHASKDLKP
jgi:Domain of unknown function (DUF4440)